MSQGKKQIKKPKNDNQLGKNVDRLTKSVYILFLVMIIWIVYLGTLGRRKIENNPYNKRIDKRAEYITRGTIYSADGEILAKTVNENGTEVREYPYGTALAASVGYSTMGKAGIEGLFNYYLLQTENNDLSRILKTFSGEKSQGLSLYTTLDVEASKSAYEALGEYRGGAVAVDVKTGEILLLVSKPFIDPNDYEDRWEEIIKDNTSPLLNRVTEATFTPGSIFKTLTLLEYMRENDEYKDFDFDCQGTYTVGDNSISCIYHSAHGDVNITRAYAYSCNCAFANMGLMLDLARFNENNKSLYFNRSLPGQITPINSSYVLGDKASTFDIMQTVIGQGRTLMSPMHAVELAMAIANNGKLVSPYMVSKVVGSDNKNYYKYNISTVKLMSSKEADALKGYMKDVVEYGTLSSISSDNYKVYGKTGSADYDVENGLYHSWFMGFAEYEDRTIAVCAVVENAENGSVRGMDVAHAIFEALR